MPPDYAITTDHVRMYKTIIDKLGALHQLCIFHFFKLIGDDVYNILKSKKEVYRDKIRLCMYFTDIKNVFRVYDEEIAIEMFETLLDDFDAIPSVLQKCIRKKIIPDFDRLTAFMRDGFIARTSNQCENYYSTDRSRGDKAQIPDISGDISISCRKDGVLDREVRSGTRTPRNVTASIHQKI